MKVILFYEIQLLQEGHWVWENSKRPLTFINWLFGEPNNAGGNENCADVDFSNNHKWVDIQCERKNRAKPFCHTDKIAGLKVKKVSLSTYLKVFIQLIVKLSFFCFLV